MIPSELMTMSEGLGRQLGATGVVWPILGRVYGSAPGQGRPPPGSRLEAAAGLCECAVRRERGAGRATIHLQQSTTATPEQFVAALTDFGPGRSEIFSRSADGYLKVHERALGFLINFIGQRVLGKELRHALKAIEARNDDGGDGQRLTPA